MFYERDEHLSKIREHSAYPIYRKFVRMLCILAYIAIGMGVLAGLVSAFTSESPTTAMIGIAGGSILAALTVLCVLLFQEVSLMLVDAVDSILTKNSYSLEVLKEDANPPLPEKTLTKERVPEPQPIARKPAEEAPEVAPVPPPKQRLVDESVREEYRKSQQT